MGSANIFRAFLLATAVLVGSAGCSGGKASAGSKASKDAAEMAEPSNGGDMDGADSLEPEEGDGLIEAEAAPAGGMDAPPASAGAFSSSFANKTPEQKLAWLIAKIEEDPTRLDQVERKNVLLYSYIRAKRPDLIQERDRIARDAKLEAEQKAKAESTDRIVFTREDNNRTLRDGEETKRRIAREETEKWGRTLTDQERLEVRQYGKPLTEEERSEKFKEELEARKESEAEAAKAAAEREAAAAKAREDAAARAAAEKQRKIDDLRALGGDQYNIRRNELIDQGVIDADRDYRRDDDRGRN